MVLTGLGLSSPVGRGVAECWANLLAGRSGIGPISLFDTRALPVRIGGEVKNLPGERLAAAFPEAVRETDRKIWLGLDAGGEAVADAGLPPQAFERAWLFVGVSLEAFRLDLVSPLGRLRDPASALAESRLAREGGDRLQTPLDRLTQILGDHYGMQGRRYTNCSACAAGAQVIGESFRCLRAGLAEVALAGAADSALNPLALGGFSRLGILSTENDQPAKACRPFDLTRQGTVLGEGAVFAVLETLEHAQARGARVYAEVLGYGASLDAYRVTDPEPAGRGAVLSMTKALRDASLAPRAVDAVNAHGTGTPRNDVAETHAIKQALGERAFAIPVTANKSMTGHLIATSGAMQAAVSALMLFARQVPPTINLEQRDPQCDLDHVTDGARDFHGRTVLSNSFGFGGQNATLIFGSYAPSRLR